MKKVVSILAFVNICTFSFGQNNDLQARYIYSKAEYSYAKNQFADAINFCEEAVKKLGQTNQKILFLELESYAGLLTQKCDDPLFNNITKIDNYLDLYLNKLSNGVDDEKIISIMKFKDQWTDYKTNGCPALTYADLHLGLKFRDRSARQSQFGKNMCNFWEVTEISAGPLKNITGTASKTTFNFYNSAVKEKDIEGQDLAIGFLVEGITLYFVHQDEELKTNDTEAEMKRKLQKRNELVFKQEMMNGNYYMGSSVEFESSVNAWLKKETATKHISDTIFISFYGRYPNDVKITNYYHANIPLQN